VATRMRSRVSRLRSCKGARTSARGMRNKIERGSISCYGGAAERFQGSVQGREAGASLLTTPYARASLYTECSVPASRSCRPSRIAGPGCASVTQGAEAHPHDQHAERAPPTTPRCPGNPSDQAKGVSRNARSRMRLHCRGNEVDAFRRRRHALPARVCATDEPKHVVTERAS